MNYSLFYCCHTNALHIIIDFADGLPKFSVEQVMKVYGVPINPVRHYLHTSAVRSVRPEQRWLQGYDSDGETEWQDDYEREKLHDFIDCNPQEKYFMSLWNAFTRRLAPLMSFKMKDVLCRFVLQHAIEIEINEAYPALVAQLSILRRDSVITAQQSFQVHYQFSTNICFSLSGVSLLVGNSNVQEHFSLSNNGWTRFSVIKRRDSFYQL